MFQYLVRRLIFAVALLLVETLIGFVLFYLIPSDPAKQACGKTCTPAMVKRVAHYLGTDRPVYIQYLRFVGRLMPVTFYGGFHFRAPSLGKSFVSNQTVNRIVANGAPETFSLVLGAVLLWMLVALPVGILSALRPRSLLDRTTMTGVLIGVSMHPVWLGLILLYVFTNKFHWLPSGGYANFWHPDYAGQAYGPWQWAEHLILPWFTLAVLFMAVYVRMIRANVMDTMNEDYVRTARAKGAPEWQVMRSHILRNALLPVVTMLGMDIGLALGGAIFTESIYSLHGLGWWALYGVDNFDSPTVLGILVVAATIVIVFNLFVDLLYAWIDPRIRIA